MRKTNEDAKKQMREEIRQWAERIGVKPKRIQIQRMTRKWASCSETGRICFSIDLLDETPDFREVVIVHELLHLQVPNHGRLFKSLMNAYLPGWELRVQGRAGRICGSARKNDTGGRHQ